MEWRDARCQVQTKPDDDVLALRSDVRGADDGTRTRNLLFTKQLLCQLSYVGGMVATQMHDLCNYAMVLAVEPTWFRTQGGL